MASSSTTATDASDFMVRTDSLKPNPWNTNVVPPENEAKVDASIKRFGMFKPILVRTLPDGTLEIIGGKHRWDAANRLGMEQVPIWNLGTVPDQKAQEIGLVDNGRYGEDDSLSLAALLRSLGTAEELQTFLPYGEDDLESIFSATSIDLDSLDAPADDTLPELPAAKPAPSHQVMRFKIPVEDVAWITELIEQRMRAQNFTAEDSLTNAGAALVHILNQSKA
jgi:ParB family chromosome partitioning protein